MSDEGFISRWSRRKTASKVTPEAGRDPPTAGVIPAEAGTQSPSPVTPAQSQEPLPPVESLTPDSDFTPFMKPEVDADTKRKAVKMLFQDPRFNVMDGLDTYIDDYSKPDPLPDGWLEKMTQVGRLGEYRDPDWVKPEQDAENAAKTALEDDQRAAAVAENQEREQALAVPPKGAPADTSEGGSPDTEVKELPPRG